MACRKKGLIILGVVGMCVSVSNTLYGMDIDLSMKQYSESSLATQEADLSGLLRLEYGGVTEGVVAPMSEESRAFSEQDDFLSDSSSVTLASKYYESTYDDVKNEDWFKNGVEDAYQMKLMVGEGVKKFNPSGDFTIAQVITVASRIHAIDNTGSLDVINPNPGNLWYEGSVQYAIEQGIIKDDDFSMSVMNRPATRSQVLYILSGCLPESELSAINEDITFTDLSKNMQYYDEIQLMAEAGIIAGYEDGSFKPSAKVSRAEASVFISRLVRPSGRIKMQSTSDKGNEDDKPEVVSEDIYYTAPNGEKFLMVRGDTPVNENKTVYVTETNKYGQRVYDRPSSGLEPINVLYGRHTYSSNNQKEYDTVVELVNQMFRFEGRHGQALKESLDAFWTNNKINYIATLGAERELGAKTESEVFEYYLIEQAVGRARDYTSSKDGDGDSAYAQMIGGEGDCTADAMTASLVLDIMGFNTKTVGGKNHEWVVFEMDGRTLHIPSGGIRDSADYEFNTTEFTR